MEQRKKKVNHTKKQKKVLEQIENAYEKSKIRRKQQIREVYEKIFNPEEYVWFCPKCGVGIMRRYEEGDIPFSEEEFGGEGNYMCFRCDVCENEEFEPFD